MDTNVLPAVRHVDRITTKVDHGPTAQADSSSIIIAPDNVRLIDPFLIMGEEWWRSPGFDWHPHRGIETITVVLDGGLEHAEPGNLPGPERRGGDPVADRAGRWENPRVIDRDEIEVTSKLLAYAPPTCSVTTCMGGCWPVCTATTR
jgi:hypothetical protein